MSKGIMNGTGESKFVPSGKTSRAMFAAMLYRLEKSPKVLKNNEFVDAQGYLQGTAASILSGPRLDLTAKLVELDVRGTIPAPAKHRLFSSKML